MPKDHPSKPVVVITGANGAIGTALTKALQRSYRVVGLDLDCDAAASDCRELDLSSPESVETALEGIRADYGDHIAAVVHLAAYFDFSGEEHPLYEKVNVEGTRNLLRALQSFEVERLVYSGTMLVHRAAEPGERIDEDAPIRPKWAYPISKARAEEVIREERGKMPSVRLHLAGLYDDRTAVPTLANQIARIYERDFHSRLFAGDPRAGQSVIHIDDMIDALKRAVDRRAELPDDVAILIGEPDPLSYRNLQDEIGRLLHGEEEWRTISLPKSAAKAGAWAEVQAEPVIPDAWDKGEEPFIKPFMIEMAEDHYALDITRARRLLGWEPRHDIRERLPRIIAALKEDPLGWYRANGVTPPDWMEAAAEKADDLHDLKRRRAAATRKAHLANLWAHFFTAALGLWLITSPAILGYESGAMAWSDIIAGALVTVLGLMSVHERFALLRWANAAIGCWLLFAPLAFWVPSAAAYLNGTLVGALVIGLSVLTRPVPGVSTAAAMTGPDIPPGWDFSPSSWSQRLPIIILALVGFFISRHLAAYQLGHIDGVWEPFFAGGPDPKNGTEEIITSSVSEAWPVPDAGVGALTYMLEILTGVIGTRRRWRTTPWLVTLFGLMIVPLGGVSIFFIIIQPIVIGTWCTLCLIAAAAMLVQIPYSLDELVATGQFLARRKRARRPILRVFFRGDTDEGDRREADDDFQRNPWAVVKDMASGGVGLPWNLALSILIGVWLMFTRLTLGAEGGMANADHLIGALVVTTSVIATAETARAVRFVNILFGIALLATPVIYGPPVAATVASLICGAALIALSIRRGRIRNSYGDWDRFIV